MKVITLGTAGGRPSEHRNTSATAIVHDDGSWVLVDCGDGALRQAMRMGLDTAKLRGVCITHKHIDHIGGLTAVLYDLKYSKFKDVWVVAPEDAHAYINAIRATVPGLENVTLHATNAKAEYTLGGFTITTKEMVHTTESWGYKATANGKMVCVCGDNANPGKLAAWVEGADWVSHEATFLDNNTENAAKWGHTTLTDLLAAVEGWNVGIVVITHQGRWVSEAERDSMRAELIRNNIGHIAVANDFDGWTL